MNRVIRLIQATLARLSLIAGALSCKKDFGLNLRRGFTRQPQSNTMRVVPRAPTLVGGSQIRVGRLDSGSCLQKLFFAGVAQLVERYLAKV